jgi:hypothetical protein
VRLVGDPLGSSIRDDDVAADEWRFRLLQAGLTLHIGASSALWLWPRSHVWAGCVFIVMFLGCGASIVGKYSWLPGLALLAVSLSEYVGVPIALLPVELANHNLVEHCVYGMTLLAAAGDAQGRAAVVSAARTTVAVVLFYAGCQKAWYGHYFDGQYLAWLNSHEPRFHEFFRLIGLDAHFTSDRSALQFKATSATGVLLSNAAWLGEITCGLLLLSRRWVEVGAVGGLLLLVAIQMAARELFFAGLVAQLLLLFLPLRTAVAATPLVGSFYLLLLAARMSSNGLEFGR